MEEIRLNKFLSDAGVCSRREADREIEAGKVLVNGVKAVVGQKVKETDKIMFHGENVARTHERNILLAVNKPVGVVCTTAEDEPANIVTFVAA